MTFGTVCGLIQFETSGSGWVLRTLPLLVGPECLAAGGVVQAEGETLGFSSGMSIAPGSPFGSGVVGGLATAEVVQNGPADLVERLGSGSGLVLVSLTVGVR